jgi:hypothetical protein
MSKTATNTTSCDASFSDMASQSSSYSKASLSSLHSSFRIAGTYRTAPTTRRKRTTSSFQTAASNRIPESSSYPKLAVAPRTPIVTLLLEHSNAIVFLAIFGTLVATNPLARQLLDHCASVSGVVLGMWALVGQHHCHLSLLELSATAEGIWNQPAAFVRALLEL